MVSLIRVVLVLLFVPALLASSQSCGVTVSQTRTASGQYNTYSATALNPGSSAVSNVQLAANHNLHTFTGVTGQSGNYVIPGVIAAGGSFQFTYTVSNSHTVTWITSCSTASSSTGSSSHTSAPTTKPTAAPTTKPTTAPTTKPSTAPTTKPTTAPTTKPAATTVPPSSAAGGRICPTGSWWAPAPLTTWQWQLTGTIDTTKNVQMYDIDMFDAPQSVIDTLHSQGKAVICYFSTQYEDWRPDAASFTSAVMGNGLDGWAGENYVDIRSPVVRAIMTSRMAIAVSKKCDGIEPDNVDGYSASTGFPLTAADQINFNTFIATQAHAVGLSVGLKNDVDQAKTLQPNFDWALDEQCYEYSECDTLSSFVTAGKAVFNCEYSGKAATVCPYMNNIKYSSLIKTLDLTAAITAQCCTYGSCAAAPHQCITSMSSRSTRNVDETITPEFTTEEIPTASAPALYASFAVAFFALVAIIL